MRLLPFGDRALLVELDDEAEVAPWTAAVRTVLADLPGVVDIVPAARTVLVRVDPVRSPLGRVRELLDPLDPSTVSVDTVPSATVVLDVRYDGEDLVEVATRTGLSESEVISRHTGATYISAFCGFAPGFAYLRGLDPRLRLPRRTTPRPRVPRGSVAIAADYCGVYPNDMPGGWHLLGRTDAVLWDLGRRPPALLAPGTTVRFRAVR